MPAREFYNAYYLTIAFRIGARSLEPIVKREMERAFPETAGSAGSAAPNFQASARVQLLKRVLEDDEAFDDATNALHAIMLANGQASQARKLRRIAKGVRGWLPVFRTVHRWIRAKDSETDEDTALEYGVVRPLLSEQDIRREMRTIKEQNAIAKIPPARRTDAVLRSARARIRFDVDDPKHAKLRMKEDGEMEDICKTAFDVYAFAKKTERCPVWVAMCRESFSARYAKQWISADRTWCLYNVGKIVSAQIPEHRVVRPFEALTRGVDVGVVLNGLMKVIELRTWRAHERSATRPEVLQSLEDLARLMVMFKCDEADVRRIREVQREANDRTTVKRTVTRRWCVEIGLYRMIADFEARLETLRGKDDVALPKRYLGGTIEFLGKDTIATDAQLEVMDSVEFKAMCKTAATARHWIHHDNGRAMPDVNEVARCCGTMLSRLGLIPAVESWMWTDAFAGGASGGNDDAMVDIELTEIRPSTRELMRISRPRARYFVGDSKRIRGTVTKLRLDRPKEATRVVVHGASGAGKDSFVMECLQDPIFGTLNGWIQGWIVGTNRESFERSLVDLFRAQRSELLSGCDDDREKALTRIRQWLEDPTNTWFLVVEDLIASEMEAFEKWIPKGRGKVLVTSRQPDWQGLGCEKDRDGVELKGFTAKQCVELWRKMGVEVCLVENEKKRLKEAGKGIDEAAIRAAVNAELESEKLARFFEDIVCGLPYFAYTCGNMLKKLRLTIDETIEKVSQKKVQKVDIEGFDAKMNTRARGLTRSIRLPYERARDRLVEPHARARVDAMLSVLCAWLPNAGVPESLFLAGRQIRSDEEKNEAKEGKESERAEEAEEMPRARLCFELSRSELEDARRVLIASGVLQVAEDDPSHVGFMHQITQRCLREVMEEDASDAADEVRESAREGLVEALDARFHTRRFIAHDVRRHWKELAGLAACVETYLRRRGDGDDVMPEEAGMWYFAHQYHREIRGDVRRASECAEKGWKLCERALARVSDLSTAGMATKDDDDDVATAWMRYRWKREAVFAAHMRGRALEMTGDNAGALRFYERSLEMQYAIHPEGKKAKTRKIASSLHQLGVVLEDIGDLKGARAKYEASLEMEYAIHPEGKKAKTSGIAATLHNLGGVLQAIGDLKGARATYEASLEMEYAIHPEGKKAKTSAIAVSLHQLGIVLQAIGDLKGARAKYVASLEMKYAIHPEGKKAKTSGIASSLHQLGIVLQAIGDLEGARAKYEASLEMKYAIHPEGKKAKTNGIAASLHELGRVLQAIGDLKGARAKYEASLEMQYAIHPEGKKAKTSGIGATLTGLAVIAHSLRDFDACLAYYLHALNISDTLFSDVDAFHSSILGRAENTFKAHLDAGSSYETILDFVTDRHRRLMSGQARSKQSKSKISQALAEWESLIAYVRRTEKDIRGKHRRSVKLRAGRASAARKQAARVASSAAKFAKRVAESNLKQDTTKKTTKKKTKKKKKKKKKRK